jgi:ABC-2 type transport system permease protein
MNTIATTGVSRMAVGPAAAMPPGRIVRAYLQEARFDFLQMLRAPAFAFPFLVLPVALYLLFGVVFAGQTPPPKASPAMTTYLMSSFCTFGVIGPGMFGFGIWLAMEREQGLLKLKRALPAPLGAHLIAKMLMSIAFAAIATASVVIAAIAAGQVTLGPGALITLCAVLIAGAVPFCAIGMLIGAYTSSGAAPAVVNLVYLPGLWLSGLFFPLPDVLRPWAIVWPAFHLNQAALGAAGVTEVSFVDPLLSGAVLIAITVLCAGLALRRLARVG